MVGELLSPPSWNTDRSSSNINNVNDNINDPFSQGSGCGDGNPMPPLPGDGLWPSQSPKKKPSKGRFVSGLKNLLPGNKGRSKQPQINGDDDINMMIPSSPGAPFDPLSMSAGGIGGGEPSSGGGGHRRSASSIPASPARLLAATQDPGLQRRATTGAASSFPLKKKQPPTLPSSAGNQTNTEWKGAQGRSEGLSAALAKLKKAGAGGASTDMETSGDSTTCEETRSSPSGSDESELSRSDIGGMGRSGDGSNILRVVSTGSSEVGSSLLGDMRDAVDPQLAQMGAASGGGGRRHHANERRRGGSDSIPRTVEAVLESPYDDDELSQATGNRLDGSNRMSNSRRGPPGHPQGMPRRGGRPDDRSVYSQRDALARNSDDASSVGDGSVLDQSLRIDENGTFRPSSSDRYGGGRNPRARGGYVDDDDRSHYSRASQYSRSHRPPPPQDDYDDERSYRSGAGPRRAPVGRTGSRGYAMNDASHRSRRAGPRFLTEGIPENESSRNVDHRLMNHRHDLHQQPPSERNVGHRPPYRMSNDDRSVTSHQSRYSQVDRSIRRDDRRREDPHADDRSVASGYSRHSMMGKSIRFDRQSDDRSVVSHMSRHTQMDRSDRRGGGRYEQDDRSRYERDDRSRYERDRDDRSRYGRDSRSRYGDDDRSRCGDDRSRYGGDDRSRYGGDDRSRYGGDDRSRYGGDDRSRYGGDDRSRYGRDDRSRYGRDDRSRYGRDDRSRYGRDDRSHYEQDDRSRYGRDDRSRYGRDDRSRYERDDRSRYGRDRYDGDYEDDYDERSRCSRMSCQSYRPPSGRREADRGGYRGDPRRPPSDGRPQEHKRYQQEDANDLGRGGSRHTRRSVDPHTDGQSVHSRQSQGSRQSRVSRVSGGSGLSFGTKQRNEYGDARVGSFRVKPEIGAIPGRIPSADAHEDVYVDVGPGVKAHFRDTTEAKSAVANDFYSAVMCFSCNTSLYCIANVEYFICQVCKTISSAALHDEMTSSSTLIMKKAPPKLVRHGAGIGFTFEALAKMQNEISSERTKLKVEKDEKERGRQSEQPTRITVGSMR